MATKWQEPPRDALDTLVLGHVDISTLSHLEQLDYMPFDPSIKRTESTIRDKQTKEEYKVTKGAPQILIQLIKSNKSYDETSKKVTEQVEKDMTNYGLRGIRCLAVARTVIISPKNGPEWQFLG